MKTKTVKATVVKTFKFPFVECFNNYDLLVHKRDVLNGIFVEKIKCNYYVGDRTYWGLFYIGKLPTIKEIRALLKKAGFKPVEEGDGG